MKQETLMLYSSWEESLPLGAKRRVSDVLEGSRVEESIHLTGLAVSNKRGMNIGSNTIGFHFDY